MTTTAHDKAMRELLAFYQEAGVDVAVGETPVDRLTEPMPAPPAPEPVRPPPAAARPATPVRTLTPRDLATNAAAAPPSPDAAVMAAREAATTAATLDELRAILDRFEGCALRATATQLVFARGNPQARVMFVGEAPGYEEDKSGLPFVGRSGQLLDRMMAAIGLDETTAYIANIVPWRPPGNRTPTPQESAICLPFIRRQIELVDRERAGVPRRPVGADAAQHPRRHHQVARPLVSVPDRQPRDPRAGDLPSGLPAAQPAAEAARLARFPGAAQSAGELRRCSPDGAISAFTRVFDALWRNPGSTAPHSAALHAGYKEYVTT